jgi:hypothetical protein
MRSITTILAHITLLEGIFAGEKLADASNNIHIRNAGLASDDATAASTLHPVTENVCSE